jgi:hypothetical protein
MWSRFSTGFYVRFIIFGVQLLAFSAFACWCVRYGSNDALSVAEVDGIMRAAFVGGYLSTLVSCYFLSREVMQCVSCIGEDGLRDYLEVWNLLQVSAHSLQIASLVMFMSGSDPKHTKLVSTYAVFTHWINCLYFLKAFRQISFLLQILTTIIADMRAFLIIMFLLTAAVALSMVVLVGDLPNAEGTVVMTFTAIVDFVIRFAEGRKDMDDSAYLGVLEQMDRGDVAENALYWTGYWLVYFLLMFITIVALNALIALMGSSYEKVVEKKISQR